MLDPVAVALKFGFLAVLYLFLLWVARSSLKDLRRSVAGPAGPAPDYEMATGMHSAAAVMGAGGAGGAPRLRVRTAPGLRDGSAYDLSGEVLLGRGDDVDIRLEDSFASSRHARLIPQGETTVLEDLGSTNGTYLDRARVTGPTPLAIGAPVRIGKTVLELRA